MALNDYRFALEFQETLKRLVSEELERQRPRYQMATVVSIDRATSSCTVTYPGDSSSGRVSMGSVQPSAVGQVVRIEGLSGDRYISDVMGLSYNLYPPTMYPNLAPQGDMETVYTLPTDISDYSKYPNQYSIIGTAVGSGGAVSAAFSTAQVHSGTRSLLLSTSSAGSPSNSIQVKSPHFDVEPGATYCATVWILKNVTTVSKAYIRIMGGSTDTLAEYVGTNINNCIPTVLTFEDKNLTTQNVWQQVTMTFTAPANIRRAAFRFYNWLPTTGTGLHFDDIRVIKVDGNPMSDTGWCRIPITNTAAYVPYGTFGDPMLRRIGNIVYYDGALNNQVSGGADSTTLSTANVIHNIPPLFRPAVELVDPSFVCQGSGANRWSLRVQNDGDTFVSRYGPGTPSAVGAWLPFAVAWPAN